MNSTVRLMGIASICALTKSCTISQTPSDTGVHIPVSQKLASWNVFEENKQEFVKLIAKARGIYIDSSYIRMRYYYRPSSSPRIAGLFYITDFKHTGAIPVLVSINCINYIGIGLSKPAQQDSVKRAIAAHRGVFTAKEEGIIMQKMLLGH